MLNEGTKNYLEASGDRRRAILREQYLARVPSSNTSQRERVLFHFENLAEFTRRLNLIECKTGSQPILKPSMLINNDLFVCVELCAECIQENAFLRTDEELWICWSAFVEVIEALKLKQASDKMVEASFLLLHLATLIIKRRIVNGSAEREPQILAVAEGYRALANEFPHPLFEAGKSSSEQLVNLTDNLKSLAHACISQK